MNEIAITPNAILFLTRLCVSVLRGKNVNPFGVESATLAGLRRHIATTGTGAGLTDAETGAAVDELDGFGLVEVHGSEVSLTPLGVRWYAGHLPARRRR